MTHIDIWSDIACPFCYIGKRRLEAALAQLPKKPAPTIRWHSYLLDPLRPVQSTQSIETLLAQKYGQSLEWARQANQRVSAMGAELGLSFDFKRLVPTNTLDAHRLVKLAETIGQDNAAEEQLFAAYFSRGLNVADHQVLIDIGIGLGVAEESVGAMLEKSDYKDAVQQDIDQARALGIQGVPFFVFDQSRVISGAQEVAEFVAALSQ